MKVFYDYQILRAQEYGGISRYFYELISESKRQGLYESMLPVICSRNYYFKDQYGIYRGKENAIARKTINAINQMNAVVMAGGQYDIAHPTYYNPYLLGKTKAKIVVTVYDMNYELMPEAFPDTQIPEWKRRFLYGSDHIIAISESTKRDILAFYPDISPEKIDVVYLGNSMKPEIAQPPRDLLPERYILFVGWRVRYKNFNNFVRAMLPILKDDPTLRIVCIGGGPFSKAEREFFEGCGIGGRLVQMTCSDEEMAYAYAHAQLFVFPSRYEGFGIPVLEAFACGCPMVLSNASSLPEVGGDAVLYFDPDDPMQMEPCVRSLLTDANLRESLIEKGRERLELFAWSNCARETAAIYAKLPS